MFGLKPEAMTVMTFGGLPKADCDSAVPEDTSKSALTHMICKVGAKAHWSCANRCVHQTCPRRLTRLYVGAANDSAAHCMLLYIPSLEFFTIV